MIDSTIDIPKEVQVTKDWDEIKNSDWRPMLTTPTDGTTFDLLCQSNADPSILVIVREIKWGHAPMDKTKLVLWGSKNILSPFLFPIGWKPRDENIHKQ